jgi:hypothetical protein
MTIVELVDGAEIARPKGDAAAQTNTTEHNPTRQESDILNLYYKLIVIEQEYVHYFIYIIHIYNRKEKNRTKKNGKGWKARETGSRMGGGGENSMLRKVALPPPVKNEGKT